MSERFIFIVFLFFACCGAVRPEANTHNKFTTSSQTENYFYHTVDRGETVYAISVMYDVTTEAIYNLNPGSREVIKAGDVLKIPQKSQQIVFHTIQPKETLYAVSKQYNIKGEDILAANPGLSVQTFTIGKTILIPVYKEQSIGISDKTAADEPESKVNALLKQKPEIVDVNLIEVALLLPFGTVDAESGNASHSQRFVEYYEGFLMALDSLKRTGVSVKLHVFDTGYKMSSLRTVLDKKELNSVHLIIGGFSEEQISALSVFAKARGIRYVIPFTSKTNDVMNNPFIFQTNPPQSYIYSTVSGAFAGKYSRDNILFVDMGTEDDKAELIRQMKSDLDSKGVTYQTIVYTVSGFSAELRSSLAGNKRNVIVLSSGASDALAKVVAPLRQMREAGNRTYVTLFGFPEWQTYIKDYIDDYFATNTCIYSIFFANNTDPVLKAFYQQFRNWYGKSTINSYPKYALLGYDAGMYFLQMIDKYGVSFENSLNKFHYQSLQTGYHFNRINNWGGFINTNVFFVEYQSDYRIDREAVR